MNKKKKEILKQMKNEKYYKEGFSLTCEYQLELSAKA